MHSCSRQVSMATEMPYGYNLSMETTSSGQVLCTSIANNAITQHKKRYDGNRANADAGFIQHLQKICRPTKP